MITKRYHYIFDASNVAEKYHNKEHVENMLKEMPPLLNMTILSGPNVVDGELVNPGVSGFCIIDYSHISIHTFSDPKEAMVDIFSCKPYEPEKIKAYLMESFGVSDKDVNFVKVMYG